MSWKNVSGKLTRFFGFASASARERFLARVHELAEEHAHPVSCSVLGSKAIVVTCGSNATKDHYIGAKVDALAKSIWGTKGSNSMSVTSKIAELHLAKCAGLMDLVAKGGKALGKTVDLVGSAHGLPGMAADKFMPKALGSAVSNVPGLKRFSSQARVGEFTPHMPSGQDMMYRSPGLSAGEYGQSMANEARLSSAEHPNPAGIEEGLTRFQNQTNGTFNLGGMGELRGTLKHMESQGLQGTPAYQALQNKVNRVNLNRAGGVAGGVFAGDMYGATANPNAAPAKASPFSSIAEFPASFADNMGAHNAAKMMRDNPGVTTGIGSAAAMALLYNMMAPRGR